MHACCLSAAASGGGGCCGDNQCQLVQAGELGQVLICPKRCCEDAALVTAFRDRVMCPCGG